MKTIFKVILVIVLIYLIHEKNKNFSPKYEIQKPKLTQTQSNPSSRNKYNISFDIRPLGDVSQSDLQYAAKVIYDFYGYRCNIKSKIPLTEEMGIEGTTQIINGKNTISELKEYKKTIFIVNKKIWWKEELRGLTNGSIILASNDRKIIKETLIHEIGHTLNLYHCNDLTCIMAIHNDEYDSGDFCKKCKNLLNNQSLVKN
jgi:predicted Zn-dependent protease